MTEDEAKLDLELAAEIERRATVLADGRKIIRLAGLFQADLNGIPDDQDPVAEALAELRRERDRHFDEEWHVLPFLPPKESQDSN
jgi:hypothetical protein